VPAAPAGIVVRFPFKVVDLGTFSLISWLPYYLLFLELAMETLELLYFEGEFYKI